MKAKLGKKLLATVLTLGVMVSMLPVTASAAPSDAENVTRTEEGSLDNLIMNKTAKLEDDGTYTINLEAYAKGNVNTTVTTTKEPIPTDFILILDQSGSMKDPMTGIPGEGYTQVNRVTNAQLSNGNYYYKVGNNYYKVVATKEQVGSEIRYKGDDGNPYEDSDLAYNWTSSSGYTYNTARPFVAESLKTYTRHTTTNVGGTYWYENDENSNDHSSHSVFGPYSAKDARDTFTREYAVNGNTVEFHNDGAPEGGRPGEANPYYVAAVYIAVTPEQTDIYRYSYSYVDSKGTTHILGTSSTNGTADEVDEETANLSPLYTQNTTTGQRLDGLKYAVNNFVDEIEATGVNHRVALVGFASDGNYHSGLGSLDWENTELFVGENQYNYNDGSTNNRYAAAHYNEALQDVSTSQGQANIDASINALDASGATYPQWGFTMAEGIFDSSDASYIKQDGTTGTRNRVVIFFTDGYPGYNYENQDSEEANATAAKAETLKSIYDADVYCVACIESIAENSSADNYLKAVATDGTYQQATTAEALDEFFESIEHEVTDTTTSTTVSLSKYSCMIDEFSNYFAVPEGFSIENNVTVQTARYTGYGSFANPDTAQEDVTTSLLYAADGTTVNGISVSGFDYVSQENIVSQVEGDSSDTASGNKLIVTIKGLLAKDIAATNTYINTNTSNSGIWDQSDGVWAQVKAFNMPTTRIAEKSYVLDYAKSAELDAFDTSADKLDSAKDEIFSKVGKDNTSVTGTYGTSAVAESKLTYTPSTTNWSGFDSFYALGKDKTYGDTQTHNMWAKVNVIPANNVYYEDDFITNDSTGTVGIEYNENWSVVTDASPDSSADTPAVGNGNTATPNPENHGGWQNSSLADDDKYSDGTAHMANTRGAKATFTFTGSGVDIYSRTNAKTGYVVAELFKYEPKEDGSEEEKEVLTQSYVIDNKSESGDYYQIPTVSFTCDEYGKYKVVLNVASTSDGRSTYYLDGIRVYNPLSDSQEADSTVSEAYGDEIGATFIEVRDILLDASGLETDEDGNVIIPDDATLSGVVFLDGTSEATFNVGKYYNYGPKNEVYLAKNQAILVQIGAGQKLAVGLKAPAGETDVLVTDNTDNTEEAAGNIHLQSASDLYYPVTANENGYIMIKNTGDNLLSVTKLKRTSSTEIMSFNLADAIAYANKFDSLPVVEYTAAPSDEGQQDQNIEEQPSDEEGDVVIENPTETPDQNEQANQERPLKTWVENLINGILNMFGRW